MQAQRLYTIAANADYAVGQFYLGALMLRQGVAEGMQWMQRAADNGYAPAQYWMGRYYEHGMRDLPMDKKRAMAYFRRAAKQGHLFAQRWLALRGVRGKNGIVGFVNGLVCFVSMLIRAAKLGLSSDLDRNWLHP